MAPRAVGGAPAGRGRPDGQRICIFCTAAASILEAVWRRISRHRRERVVVDDLSPVWVTRAMITRTRRILQARDAEQAGMDFAQVHCARDVFPISRLHGQ